MDVADLMVSIRSAVRHLLLPDRNKRMEHITLVQFLQYIIYKNNRIMKKSYSFILVLILMAGLLCSCHINKVSGDGNVVSKEIPIKDYDEIQIEGENVDFKYMQSDDVPYLKVETDQNIMDFWISIPIAKCWLSAPKIGIPESTPPALIVNNQLDCTERVQNGRRRQL